MLLIDSFSCFQIVPLLSWNLCPFLGRDIILLFLVLSCILLEKLLAVHPKNRPTAEEVILWCSLTLIFLAHRFHIWQMFHIQWLYAFLRSRSGFLYLLIKFLWNVQNIIFLWSSVRPSTIEGIDDSCRFSMWLLDLRAFCCKFRIWCIYFKAKTVDLYVCTLLLLANQFLPFQLAEDLVALRIGP